MTRKIDLLPLFTPSAVVFADLLTDEMYLNEIRCVGAGQPEIAQLMEHTVSRKRTLFANDSPPVAVGRYPLALFPIQGTFLPQSQMLVRREFTRSLLHRIQTPKAD